MIQEEKRRSIDTIVADIIMSHYEQLLENQDKWDPEKYETSFAKVITTHEHMLRFIKKATKDREIPVVLAEDFNQLMHTFNNLMIPIYPFFRGETTYLDPKHMRNIEKFYSDKMVNSSQSQYNVLYNQLLVFIHDQSTGKTAESVRIQAEKVDQQIALLFKANEDLVDLKAKLTAREYSEIFGQEAKKFSNSNIQKLGKAQWFLIIGVISIGLLFSQIYLILDSTDLQRIEPVTNGGIEFYKYLFGRTVLLSLNVFVINFCFKQFSINSHLATLNQHRSNVLNTFELLIDSVHRDNHEVKDLLTIEMAKSIFDVRTTGYLNNKADSGSSMNIVEFTKMMGKSKPN